MASLPVTQGFAHLPLPRGPHQVGCFDVFTTPRPSMPGLLVRLYYPCSSATSAEPGNWVSWLPAPAYAQGYLRYKFSNLSPLLPCLGRIFTWLIGDPKVPATRNAPPLSSSPLTPILLSHGLAACRTSYSWLAADLASHGCLVAALEHADGSACARERREGGEVWWQEQELGESVEGYQERNRQVKERVEEARHCLDLLEKVNKGRLGQDNIWVDGCEGTSLLEQMEGCLAMEKVCIVGHSFGGATTALALAQDSRLKGGIALDSWLFPLKDESELKPPSPESLLFVNCEKFQGPTNLERMKKFTGHPGNVGLPSNVVTLKEASHYAPTDIPVILEGSRAGSVARMLGVTGVPGPTSNLAYLTITSDLVRSWVRGATGEGWEELLADVRGAGEAVQLGMQDQ